MPVPHHGEGEAEQRVLRGFRLAVELSIAILAIESVGAYLSHSLSLTVDAVHNVPDVIAFAVSWTALRSTQEGSTDQFTFGKHRLEIFAGILNGSIVLVAGVVFGYEASVSLISGSSFAGPVDAVWLLVAAVPTLILRSVNLQVLRNTPRRVRDLNFASVIVHLASDIAITAALLIAGVVLLVNPVYAWVDPLAALVIAGILVYESVPLLREGWGVLMERTPKHLSLDRIRETVLGVPGVSGVHDVHVWSVCSTLVVMTAHVGVTDMSLKESMSVLQKLRARMEEEFGIVHSTFEIEAP